MVQHSNISFFGNSERNITISMFFSALWYINHKQLETLSARAFGQTMKKINVGFLELIMGSVSYVMCLYLSSVKILPLKINHHVRNNSKISMLYQVHYLILVHV